MHIKIKTLFGSLVFEGDFSSVKECVSAAIKSGANLRNADLHDANLYGADLRGADLRGADLRGVDLYGANLRNADLRGANLYGAELRDANLYGANLRGAELYGVAIEKIRVFTGLYKYQVWALLARDGTRYVRMGCLFKSLDEWDSVDIRKTNENEFPDDGSEASEERVIAFEIAKAAALRLTAF